MTPEQIVRQYGTLSEAARRVGISKQRLYIWRQKKRVPPAEQIRIHKLTKGILKADKKVIDAFSIQ